MLKALRVILELLFWSVAAAALLFGGALLVSLGLAPALAFLGIAAVLLALPLFMRLIMHARNRRVVVLIQYLEQAVRLNLPLPRLLWAAQRSESGPTGYRLAQFRQRLEDGLPITYALEVAAPEVPERQISLLAAAERVGQLPQALARLVEEYRAKHARDVLDVMFYRTYPPIMTLIVSAVVALIAVFVLPKFEQIFKDFGLHLPPITMWTFDIARVLAPLVVIIAFFGMLWMAGRTMWETFHPMRVGDNVVRAGLDRFMWVLPLSRGLQRDRGLADAFEFMADALAAGAPIDRVLTEASALRMNIALKDKFADWARYVTRGQDLQSAARDAGMPRLVIGMLALHGNADDAAAVFRFLARYYRSRFSRTSAFLQAAVVPVVVLIFGFIVACVCLSLFTPLVSLITSMSVPARGL